MSDLKQQLAQAHKRIEELEARQAEERWHTLFEYAPDACYLCTLTGTFVNGNRKAEQLTGYDREDLIDKNFLELNLLNAKGIVRASALLARNAIGRATGPDEFQLRHKEGHWITLEISTFPTEVDGRSLVLGIARDITERKKNDAELQQYRDQLEDLVRARTADLENTNQQLQKEIEERQRAVEALRESEQTKEALLRTIPDLIFQLDRSGRFLSVLPAKDFDPILPPEQFINKTMSEVLSPELAKQAVEHINKALDTGEMTVFEYTLDMAGQKHFFEARQVACGENQVLSMIRDITEKKQMENELVRLERMRAMWELSAGVSHNLNNILTGILLPAQMLRRSTTDEKQLQRIKTISDSGHAAADLVNRLHQAIQAEEGQLETVLINDVLKDVIYATQPRWQNEPESKGIIIEIETDLEEDCKVWGFKSELFDCLVNLVFNAVDAMPLGGKIHITTTKNADTVTLKITDTGKGMDEDTRRRVFEPFFTTKVDVGTGLGLFTVYGTITRWGGHIEVQSQIGQGTSFIITLPTGKGESIAPVEKAMDLENISGQILIIEDDALVGDMIADTLTPTHTVTNITDAQQAINQFEPGQFDVAIIDLGMPGCSGDQLASIFKTRDPNLVTILITGWRLAPDDPRLSHFDFHIAKPFSDPDDIAKIVTQAVHQRKN